jgi:hypothetical protein
MTTFATPTAGHAEAELLEMDAFRDRVRHEILRRQAEGWCVPGTQAALEDLGLAPMSINFTGNAHISISIDGIRGAVDEDDARDRIIAGLSAICSDDGIDIDILDVTCDLYDSGPSGD